MAPKIIIEKNKKEKTIEFKDQKSSYVLSIRPPDENSQSRSLESVSMHCSVMFFVPPQTPDCNMKVTCRSRELYAVRDDVIYSPDRKHQYIEVGAGLGEFTPWIAENLKMKKTPIIIDPVNYKILKNLMIYARDAKRVGFKNLLRYYFDVLIQRCNTILDPDKVTLINMKLDKAIAKHPEIHGIADVVIDNNGAVLYCEAGSSGRVKSGLKKIEKTLDLERKLLKEGGVLLTYSHNLETYKELGLMVK